MTEPDLLDRMTESTAWTRTETVDPAADLARGRRRLRVRRTRIGAAAVSAVVVTALGVNALTGSTGRAPATPPVTNSESASTVSLLRHCASGADGIDNLIMPGLEAEARRLIDILAKHADPRGQHIQEPRLHAASCRRGYNGKGEGSYIDASATWQQGGRRGRAQIVVNQSGFGDPQERAAYARLHACSRSLWGRPGSVSFDCGWQTIDGRPILVGTANIQGYYCYLAGYVRPDGQIVMVWVGHGFGITSRTPDPAWRPDVTRDELVAAVVDPAMTLR